MKRVRLVALLAVLVLAVVVLAIPTLAHEGREVGEYQIVFGWRVEPAYTGLFNGPEFTVTMHGGEAHEPEGTPEAEHSDAGDDHHDEASAAVEGLEDTLQIEVSYGGQTKLLRLRAVWGEPGSYTADLIPTQPGDYSFRVFGTIGDTEIDETFSSTEGEFSSVEPVEDIQFP